MSSVVDEIREEVEEEALARGRNEGVLEEKTATARQLMKMGGFTLETIAEITRLPLDEVRAIAEKEGR